MFSAIVRFELAHHFRQPLLYITAGLLALLTFGAVSSDSVQIGGAVGQVHRNAPIVVVNFLTIISVLGVFIATAFVSSSILRDFEGGTHELFFAKPVRPRDYLLGRFAGSMVASAAVFVGPVLGIVAGSFAPWVDPQRLGPLTLAPFLFGLAVMVLPNLLFLGAAFFALAGLTRSMLATFLGVLATLVGYLVSKLWLKDLESQPLAALLDPFGIASLQSATRYWTIVERNSALPDLGAGLLANRLLWLGVGALFLALVVWRFSYARAAAGGRVKRAPGPQEGSEVGSTATPAAGAARPTPRSFGPLASLSMLVHQGRLEASAVLRSVPFLVMLAFGVFNLLASCVFGDRLYGTKVLPVTHMMLQDLSGSYFFLLMVIVTFYAGDLVWKERSLKLAEVCDALPAPSWVAMGGKLVAQGLVVGVYAAVGVLAAIGFQLSRGYPRLEPALYAKGLLLAVVPFVFVCVLATVVQVLAGSKLLGYAVMIVFLLGDDVYDALGFDHHLYRFASLPDAPYSDMNGYGHFVAPVTWFAVYWAFLCLALLGAGALFWVRGAETSWRLRWRLARQRFHGAARALVVAGLLGFAATGSYIFYNTNVLNDYLPRDEVEARQAEYEKGYRQYLDLPQPRVTDIAADVDIFPRERRVEIRGRYLLENRSGAPIPTLHLSIPPTVTVNHLEAPPHTVRLCDDRLGYHILDLNVPLAPGATAELRFDLSVVHPGFVNNDSDTTIVGNGTFFSNLEVFPLVGYNELEQLVDRAKRRKHDLPPVQRMASVDDQHARRNNYISSDADWVTFQTTVSTSADQIAIAPGYLQREWTQGGRRYFHYAMDAPILNFFAFLSADYTVRRDRFNDVAIEVFYHRPHDRNVERMVDAVKKTLEYCTKSFGPYQHRQVRILEFPRYRDFAQSFPNTIPCSESAGFIARVDDAEDIDTLFYITAHEVAHQWWAHQAVGANVQGATLMSEALAQYTALMVMEQELGRDKMRRFLKFELDRYLSGRGRELVEEMPLLLVEDQPYIHYSKGSVVTYALRDYLGEEVVNRVLARYLEQVKFQQPPYTNSLEFLSVLRDGAGPGQERLLEDLLATITLFSNRAERATATLLADGRYLVDLTVAAKKLRADGQGVESEVPVDDWVDIGVFGERQVNGRAEETVLFLEKRRITAPSTTFQLTVDALPVRAGIDPYNKLVDRDSDDNLRRVDEEPATQTQQPDPPPATAG